MTTWAEVRDRIPGSMRKGRELHDLLDEHPEVDADHSVRDALDQAHAAFEQWLERLPVDEEPSA